jgi:hypothetical protein
MMKEVLKEILNLKKKLQKNKIFKKNDKPSFYY